MKFSSITRAQALAHPTWKMGSKVTIDSATLMNKGLEVIEAYWLFGLAPEKIDVVVHPQSIIHSMVEFVDGSIKAQLGVPDMKIPIQYALTYPERTSAAYGSVNFAALGQMTFFEPDHEKFRCLGLAYQALRTGGTAPAVLNAANEVAVGMFLGGSLPFSSIPDVIEEALCAHKPVVHHLRLDDIVRADMETRDRLRKVFVPAE
jgi:1-deoxy-D-xylulose-5-phosphate reductoisomerase